MKNKSCGVDKEITYSTTKEIDKMKLFDRIINEYSREREDKINDKIFMASEEGSKQISNLIDDTYAKGHQVWLMTDWHIIKYDKVKKIEYPNPHQNLILKYASKIQPDDLLIFLGDICDGEVEDKNKISMLLHQIPGIKILVRGNNDLFPDSWYTSHGFQYITPKFVWNHILFTHRPQDNQYKINIHGHIHNSKTYYNSEISHYNNQIDVAWLDGRTKPAPLSEAIKKQPDYARVIKFIDKPYKSDKPVTAMFA